MERIPKFTLLIWSILTCALLVSFLVHASFLSALIWLFLFAVTGIVLLFLLIWGAVKQSRQAMGLAIGLMLGTTACFIFGRLPMDYVYFLSERGTYLEQIAAEHAKAHDPHAPIIEYFPWDGFLSSEYGIVYDETDGVASTRHAFIEDGKNDGDKSIDAECSIDVTSFGGHFYLRYFSC